MTSFPPQDPSICRALAPAGRRRAKRRGAFTLIETALALGIVAFALVPIVGLLPIGLQTSKSASDLTISAQIAQRLAGMVQQTDEPSSKLADGSSPLMTTYYYFDGEGQPVTTTTSPGSATTVPTSAVYTASIQLPPPVSSGSTPSLVAGSIATTLDVQIVDDPAHSLQGTPSNTALASHPNLLSHVVHVPVYFVNNGS